MADQLGDANELARRFVACRGWLWVAGMLATDGWRVAGREGDLILWGRGREVTGLSVRSENNGIPDLSDAATRGAILQLVRDAWGDPYMHCQFIIAELIQPDCWMAIADCGIASREFVGRTEAEALLAALEAAP